MKTAVHILKYVLLATTVVAVFGLLGWYFFVDSKIDQTASNDQARGFGQSPSFANSLGSTFQNIASSIANTFSIGDGVGNQPQAGNRAPRLWSVTKNPVAGLGFASSTSQLFFAERGSGNILKADPATTQIERLTNTVLPKIHEALFAPDGSVILRSINETGSVTTYAARLATTSPTMNATATPQTLQGVYLAQNISSIAQNGANSIVYLIPSQNGSGAATSDWQGRNQKQLFTSVLSNWNLQALPDGKIFVTQRAADGIDGFAFRVTSAGSLEPLVSNTPGLTILPRTNSDALIYSSAGSDGLTLIVRASANVTATILPIRTISEKCVWAPGQILIAYCAVPQAANELTLNNWYQGAVHTSDAWWRVDVSAGTATQFFTPNVALDVENPRIDTTGSYIAFMNAADKSLWMLRTTE